MTQQRDGGGAWRIGELAAHTGATAKTLRFYESIGLLEPPRRTPKGYRLYGPDAADEVRFIRRAKALGLALGQIKGLLQTARSGQSSILRAQVVDVLDGELDACERQIATLVARRAALRARKRLAVVALEAPACACHGFAADCGCLPVEAEAAAGTGADDERPAGATRG